MENKRSGDLSSAKRAVWFENIHKLLDDIKYHNEYIGNDIGNDPLSYYIDTYPLSNEQAKLITNIFIPTLENTKSPAFTIDNGMTFNVKEWLEKLYLIVANEEYTEAERETLRGLRRHYINEEGVFKPKSQTFDWDTLFKKAKKKGTNE